jgi:transcriptional repressor NrdR
MLCPYCSNADTKVTDKRDSGKLTRRRRECLKCIKRFSTHERVELSDVRVVKKDGSKQLFDRNKIKKGVIRSSEKRPVSELQIEKMVDNVEKKVRKKASDVKTSLIGELVSRELKKIDKISYIRFASVYRDFTDLSDFKKEIRSLIKK